MNANKTLAKIPLLLNQLGVEPLTQALFGLVTQSFFPHEVEEECVTIHKNVSVEGY